MKNALNINTKKDYENEINELFLYPSIKIICHLQFITSRVIVL